MLDAINHFLEISFGVLVDALFSCLLNRFAEGEGRAHDGVEIIFLVLQSSPCCFGDICLVLLARQMIDVCIFAKIRLLAHLTALFKRGPRRSGSSGSLVGKDFFRENFRGQRRQRGDSSFQVVPMPVALHVRPLQFARPECDLAGVAGEGVRRLSAHGAEIFTASLCMSTCGRWDRPVL